MCRFVMCKWWSYFVRLVAVHVRRTLRLNSRPWDHSRLVFRVGLRPLRHCWLRCTVYQEDLFCRQRVGALEGATRAVPCDCRLCWVAHWLSRW